MKKADIVFACAVVAVFLPFVLSEPVYEAYKSFNAAHGMIVSFIKFAVLSTAGEMLGAASVQMAFNLGNAVGAYCGGLPIEAGLDYRYPALIGLFFALVGFALLFYFYHRYEKRMI